MRLPYETKEPDEATIALAQKLADLAVNAQMSYERTIEALEVAQRLIVTESKPVKI